MKNAPAERIQRVDRLSSLLCNGHDVYDRVDNHRIARVAGLGERDFSYYMYDESQEDHVVSHITSLAKSRSKTYADAIVFADSEPELIFRPNIWIDDVYEI